MMVTGPSFTISTCMYSPNVPVSTLSPRPFEQLHHVLVDALRIIRGRGLDEVGTPALAGVGVEGELAHD